MNKKLLLALISVFSLGIIVGAIGAYVLVLYKTINAVDSLVDAPFGQGFFFGIGSGALIMYQHYKYPDVNSLEEFIKIYDSNEFIAEMEDAMKNSIFMETIAEYIQEQESEDAIYDWVVRSEERVRRGIFGFTVPKKEASKC